MVNYAKTILYAYPKLKAVAKFVDGKFNASMVKGRYDVMLAKDCLDELIRLTEIKSVLLDCFNQVTKILSELTKEEYEIVAYRFFGKKFTSLKNVEQLDRSYYRKLQKIVNKVRAKLSRVGITEEWFNEKFLCFPFVKELHRRVLRRCKTDCYNEELKDAQ